MKVLSYASSVDASSVSRLARLALALADARVDFLAGASVDGARRAVVVQQTRHRVAQLQVGAQQLQGCAPPPRGRVGRARAAAWAAQSRAASRVGFATNAERKVRLRKVTTSCATVYSCYLIFKAPFYLET